MGKLRFTDIEKWQPWFRRLPLEYKVFWFFLCDFCDESGVWERDDEVAHLYVSPNLDLNKSVLAFNSDKERIKFLKGGSKWLLTGFLKCQHPKGLDLNSKSQTRVFKDLAKNGLDYKDYLKPDSIAYPEAIADSLEATDSLQVKVMDKEMVKGKGIKRPTKKELTDYFTAGGLETASAEVEAQKFLDYYSSVGWVVGKTRKPMKNWQGCAATWIRNCREWKKDSSDCPNPMNLNKKQIANMEALSEFLGKERPAGPQDLRAGNGNAIGSISVD